jgi:glucose-6-phosphate 1-dehydrogenase
MLRGDATVFNRGDGAEEAWRIIEHVVTSRIVGDVPMRTCAAGGRPPRLGQ